MHRAVALVVLLAGCLGPAVDDLGASPGRTSTTPEAGADEAPPVDDCLPRLAFHQDRYVIEDEAVELAATFANGCTAQTTETCHDMNSPLPDASVVHVEAGPFDLWTATDGVGLETRGLLRAECEHVEWEPHHERTWTLVWNGTVALADHHDLEAGRHADPVPWRVPGTWPMSIRVGEHEANATVEVREGPGRFIPAGCEKARDENATLAVGVPASARLGEEIDITVQHAFHTDECAIVPAPRIEVDQDGRTAFHHHMLAPHCPTYSRDLVVLDGGDHETIWVLPWNGTACSEDREANGAYTVEARMGAARAAAGITWR